MKMIMRADDGKELEIKEINGIAEGDVVIQLRVRVKLAVVEELEDYFSKKFGRKVIILDEMVDRIFTIPPLK